MSRAVGKITVVLKELAIRVDEIHDEVDGETVLTLISYGDHGVVGYLMLKADPDYLRWDWQVSEPEAISTIAGSEDMLWDAAKRLHAAMGEMEALIAERDGS